MNGYNIKKIREEYDEKISRIKKEIMDEFIHFFNSYYTENTVPKIEPKKGYHSCLYKIDSYELTESIYSGPGIYIIFSNIEDENNSSLTIEKNIKPIYRGQCSTIKRRIQSHLCNKEYNSHYDNRGLKGEVRFNTCLKVHSNENGINITENPYRKYQWYVAIHKMQGSNRLIREQAEKAFDQLYGKPIACREK